MSSFHSLTTPFWRVLARIGKRVKNAATLCPVGDSKKLEFSIEVQNRILLWFHPPFFFLTDLEIDRPKVLIVRNFVSAIM